ncbi:S1 family peptidase [Mesorhizobium muleiense]|uniref:S1 family peptidase n=1 Tax=Mesorhizobium muleiense TaxID=1004279 RepID=UPI001F2EEFFA|nr:serine protease [Mesorhizobium muleiense]MCF6112225.1 serine protease [Mesorhizobium muleiense]
MTPFKLLRASSGRAGVRRWRCLTIFIACAFAFFGVAGADVAWAQSGCDDSYAGLVRIRLTGKRRLSSTATQDAIPAGNGTGFAVRSRNDEIFIVTAAHVVEYKPGSPLANDAGNDYEKLIEAMDCLGNQRPIELQIVRSGFAEQKPLDIAVLKIKKKGERFGQVDPLLAAWMPPVAEPIAIEVWGFKGFDDEVLGKSENEISIAPELWDGESPQAEILLNGLSSQLSRGMSGSPIRDAATGHAIGIAATRGLTSDSSGALLFRGAVKEFIERWANLHTVKYHSIKTTVERIYIRFLERPHLSNDFKELLAGELEAFAGDTREYGVTLARGITWSVDSASDLFSKVPSGLENTDDFYLVPTYDERVTTEKLRSVRDSDRATIDRLKRSLIVKVYVSGEVRETGGTIIFEPHAWYIYDTGKSIPIPLTSFPIKVKNAGGSSAGSEWTIPVGRLAVPKALLYDLVRNHVVEGPLQAEAFCTLVAPVQEGKPDKFAAAFYALVLSMHMDSIKTVGADALKVKVFSPERECLAPPDSISERVAQFHQQESSPLLAMWFDLFNIPNTKVRLHIYGRHPWTAIETWKSRRNAAFDPVSLDQLGNACDSGGEDESGFCQIRKSIVDELNKVIVGDEPDAQ